jgi:hypothetical protein
MTFVNSARCDVSLALLRAQWQSWRPDCHKE